jgi:peptidoglycan LD-endopeptidase LytH
MRRIAGLVTAGFVLVAGGTLTTGIAANSLPAEVVAGPSAVEPAIDDLATNSAAASAPAARIRPTIGFFPMNPQPRCDILDNFTDPRGGGRRHQGTDMLATKGQEVVAVMDGVLSAQVVVGGPNSSLAGNAWTLTLPDGTYFFYAHLLGFAPGLTVGSHVNAGDVIAYVGDTGNPGPGNYHLHFELHPQGGAAINPLPTLELPAGCKVF